VSQSHWLMPLFTKTIDQIEKPSIFNFFLRTLKREKTKMCLRVTWRYSVTKLGIDFSRGEIKIIKHNIFILQQFLLNKKEMIGVPNHLLRDGYQNDCRVYLLDGIKTINQYKCYRYLYF